MTTQQRQDGWRKSSFSDTGNGCVELACTSAGIRHIRDSKNPDGPTLSVDVRKLVAAVRL